MTPITTWQCGGWLGIAAPGRWVFTDARPGDPIVAAARSLVGRGDELHQIVAAFTGRPDLMYALVGSAGDVTQVVVRGPVRVELATPDDTRVFLGAPEGGDWAGHVVAAPVLSVGLSVATEDPVPPVPADPGVPRVEPLVPTAPATESLGVEGPTGIEPPAGVEPRSGGARAEPRHVPGAAEPARAERSAESAGVEPDSVGAPAEPRHVERAAESVWVKPAHVEPYPVEPYPVEPAVESAPVAAEAVSVRTGLDVPNEPEPPADLLLDPEDRPAFGPAWWAAEPAVEAPLPPRPRLGGLISDVSWADEAPSPAAPRPAPPLVASPAPPSSHAPVARPPSHAAAVPPPAQTPAGPLPPGPPSHAAVAPPPGGTPPYTPDAPRPAEDRAAAPVGPPAAPLNSPTMPLPLVTEIATPPAVAEVRTVPLGGEAPAHAWFPAAPGENLDVTIRRPITATSVMSGGPMVPAVVCVAGHPNPPPAGSCRVCARPVPPQPTVTIPRPVLGVLRMSTSDTIRLDHGVIFGRDPGTPDANRRDQPYFVMLTDKDISRRHLEVVLDGWDVYAVDLNSSNGSAVTPPGGRPEVIPAGERRLLAPGTVVHLSDKISFVLEVSGVRE